MKVQKQPNTKQPDIAENQTDEVCVFPNTCQEDAALLWQNTAKETPVPPSGLTKVQYLSVSV